MRRLGTLVTLVLAAGLGLSISACGETGQQPISYPAVGVGTSPTPFTVGAWQVTLDRADIAIGPLYLCASQNASLDLCSAARQEMTTVGVFDGLDPSEQPLGRVTGVDSRLGSARYDFGIAWLLTSPAPVPDPDIPEGHSVVMEGHATDGTRTLSLIAQVDLPPSVAGGFARTVSHIDADVPTSDFVLTVHTDPSAWWGAVDIDRLADQAAGSTDPVLIAPGYPVLADGSADPREVARNALSQAITNSAAPTLRWTPQTP